MSTWQGWAVVVISAANLALLIRWKYMDKKRGRK